MPKLQIRVCPDAAALATAAAEDIIAAAERAILGRGRFLLVLAGGSTPELTYRRLAAAENVDRVDWSRVFFFFGDERLVPPDDPRSNYGMARRSLLEHVPVAPEQVFPIPTDAPSAAEGARQYEDTLARFFGLPAGSAPPVFDLVLLGLGDDGHTASLFPHAAALQEQTAWVTWSPPGTLPPPVDRITFTFPLLNAARRVVFLVTAENKAPALQDIFEGNASLKERPAAGVQPASGELVYLLDTAAAKLLALR